MARTFALPIRNYCAYEYSYRRYEYAKNVSGSDDIMYSTVQDVVDVHYYTLPPSSCPEYGILRSPSLYPFGKFACRWSVVGGRWSGLTEP